MELLPVPQSSSSRVGTRKTLNLSTRAKTRKTKKALWWTLKRSSLTDEPRSPPAARKSQETPQQRGKVQGRRRPLQKKLALRSMWRHIRRRLVSCPMTQMTHQWSKCKSFSTCTTMISTSVRSDKHRGEPLRWFTSQPSNAL